MSQARSDHTATLLEDGTLLVVGGIHDFDQVIASAERYDPDQNSWSDAGEMSQPRWEHVAVRLEDGRVLILGGCKEEQSVVCMVDMTAELYDPSVTSGSPWTTAAAPPTSRRSLSAVRLADGRVLVAGGYDNVADYTSLEIYDPEGDSWETATAELAAPRNKGTATLLEDGTVLLAGGFNGFAPNDTLEIFDPAGDTVTPVTDTLAAARWRHTATRLDDGRVLFVGGLCDAQMPPCLIDTAEIYDPDTGEVSPAGSPGDDFYDHEATLLTGGEVMVTGGFLTDKLVKIYDPLTPGWSGTDDLRANREDHTATLLTDGRVIVTGGSVSTWTGQTAVEIYTP
jgi:hypothetical protein